MNAEDFNKLTKRDFENGAVRDEIYSDLKKLENARAIEEERDRAREIMESDLLMFKYLRQYFVQSGLSALEDIDESIREIEAALADARTEIERQGLPVIIDNQVTGRQWLIEQEAPLTGKEKP